MASRTLKLLLVLIVAATTLNLLNYIFCLFYYHPKTSNTQLKVFKVGLHHRHDDPGDYISQDEASPASGNYPSFDLDEDFSSPNGNDIDNINKIQEVCPHIPPGLPGPIAYNASMYRVPLKNIYTKIGPGGLTKVKQCKPRQRAAIIIPFKGPSIPLAFINYLHSFLMMQQLEYQVFAVEQNNVTSAYNHGKLINAAFTEIHQRYKQSESFHCFIIHDPNIVPVDTRNLYRCSWQPKQLAATIQKTANSTLELTFGKAIALTYEQYINVNGFSNVHWNNDGAYEDLLNRLIAAKYTVVRTSTKFGKYIILKNMKYRKQPSEVSESAVTTPVYKVDGLSSLSYVLNKFELRNFYTYINIKVAEDPNDVIMTWTTTHSAGK